jgi:hypothetical protein
MSLLIQQITRPGAARYGVNILDQAAPAGVRGVSTDIVAIVAELPWGPTEVVTQVDPGQAFEDVFAPDPFDAPASTYTALRALFGKTFPGLVKIVRVAADSAAAADFTFVDGSAGDSVTVTAARPGAIGNQIQVAFTENADTAANRDMTVTIGTSYSVTYTDVVVDDTGSITVNDPGDPYVSIADAGSATAPPAAITATNLTGGADGTATADNYTDAIELLADKSQVWSVGFVAECPSALIASVNAGLKTFMDTHARGFWVLSTPASETVANAQTAVASLRNTAGYLKRCWPRVKTTDLESPTRAEITVDGNAFAAVAIASVNPLRSPGGADGAPYLTGITGVEQGATAAELQALNAAGITPFIVDSALGPILHKAVTTSLTSGRTQTRRRRAATFFSESIANLLVQFLETPADVDLANRALGPNTQPEIAAIEAFLQDYLDRGEIPAYNVDPFSANTAAQLALDIFTIIVQVELFGLQSNIVLQSQVGQGVIDVSSN